MVYVSDDIPDPIIQEVAGNRSDLEWLRRDNWLMNTEVRYHIREYRSRWYLTMVFVAVQNCLQFICRYIDHYPSRQKARTYADIMQRGIRKDSRGTLKCDRNDFNFCEN